MFFFEVREDHMGFKANVPPKSHTGYLIEPRPLVEPGLMDAEDVRHLGNVHQMNRH